MLSGVGGNCLNAVGGKPQKAVVLSAVGKRVGSIGKEGPNAFGGIIP